MTSNGVVATGEVNLTAILRGKEIGFRLKDPDQISWHRFTINVIAAIEEEFGSEQALAQAMEDRPVATIRRVLALLLKCEPEQAGERMVEEETQRYWAAVEGGLALALGSTEETAGKAIRGRLAMLALGDKTQIEMWEKMAAIANSTGEAFSELGSLQDAPTKSSGTSPRRKSSSRSTD